MPFPCWNASLIWWHHGGTCLFYVYDVPFSPTILYSLCPQSTIIVRICYLLVEIKTFIFEELGSQWSCFLWNYCYSFPLTFALREKVLLCLIYLTVKHLHDFYLDNGCNHLSLYAELLNSHEIYLPVSSIHTKAWKALVVSGWSKPIQHTM